MSNLHQYIYQSYIQVMHQFCQYPQMMARLEREKLGSKVRILAIGKAAWKMAALCSHYLNDKGIVYDGIVLTKYGHTHGALPGLQILEAGHPIPDENSLAHSAKIVDWLQSIPAKEVLLILLSGGSSALFELLPEGTMLEDLIRANKSHLHSGQDIATINRARSELSLLKGGKALNFTKSKQIRIYAVSDVAGNDPQIIGSGPFTPQVPASKTTDGSLYRLTGKEVRYHIVADNQAFCTQLTAELRNQGFKAHLNSTYQNRTLQSFAEQIKDILSQAHNPRFRLRPPFVQIWGGEIALKVTGSGSGGRCSHLTLSLATTISKYPDTALFCFATDGSDNIKGSGGSFADTNTRSLLRNSGVSITQTKKSFDSFTVLRSIHHILPSPLMVTNVNDVFVLCVGYDLENPISAYSQDDYDLFEGIL